MALALEKVPAAQSVHDDCVIRVEEYLPGEHATQWLTLLMKPALQLVHVVDPGSEDW